MKTFLLILLIPVVGFSQSSLPTNLGFEFERRINSGVNHGIAMATIDSLGVIEYYNFGLENNNSKITKNSTFEIASISKTFTSALIQHLEKIAKLSTKQEIRNFVPDSLPEQIKKITFDQLINHTSGLPKLPPDYWCSNWDNPFNDHSKQKFLSSLMVTQLDSTGNWNYSNMGYALLGLIADDLTEGKGLEIIISLIDLNNTSTDLDNETSTIPHNFGKAVESWDFPNFNRYIGGIKSSSADLVKYLKYQIENNANFSSSHFNTNILINKEDSIVNKDGWLMFYRNKEEIIWHNGISGGYNSFIGFNIQTKTGTVILSNSQSSITDLGLYYLSNTFTLNKTKPSLVVKIEQHINLQQLDSLEIIWNTPDTIEFNKNPIDLHWLQCHYISKEKLEIALLLNDLLLSYYKDDWEVIFYRAKIYEIMKEYKTARKLYEEVNHLFPENEFINARITTLPNRVGGSAQN
ncbi:MAG: beta-lactamase family protein [Crocinitomicaceae bacterium]|nr:beta-lactamase family protein [Crocinitomicaceae bacterium]